MTYIQPLPTLSSIVIKGGADSPHSDESVFRHVDIDLIMNDPDVRPNLLDATDFLDESDCLSFLREYADYMPKSFELTGSVDIEGFEEID